MKIVYIIPNLYIGGAEVMLYNLLSNIDRDRFEPVILSLMDRGLFGEKFEQLDIPVHSVGMLAGKPSLASAKRITQLLKQLEPDLIQGWMYHGNLAAQFFKFVSQRKIPVFWSIHHSLHRISGEKPLTQAIIRFGSWSSRYVNRVAYVSQRSQAQHEKLGYSPANGCIIPNGFDTAKFKPSKEVRRRFRQDLNLSDDTFLIGSQARYSPMKDHANFLQAARILLQNYPATKFVMIGKDIDYNNQTLTNLIQELDIEPSVRLLGLRQDMPQITPALDVLTSSSAFGEAFPMVIGEAMSCGVPCVVTDIGDSAWMVGNTGRVVPPKNPLALAKAWQEIITMDVSARQNLGTSARQRIVEKFSLDTIVQQYEQLYQSAFGLQSSPY
ncbi:glycosyltransferase [Pleurocapsales cyanobacterium LEGE 10410]|nr:glycosyltransferase [Pleurocapsales cyanobacterium LEGE 10410]